MAKSKRLDGQFMDNQIQEIRLTGNAESVMHIFNDESALQGTNQSTSSWISLHFVLGELTNVKVGKNIDATYVPASSGEVPKLEGCVNEFNLRPSKASTLLILK
jgi:hypothetical protein